jgi:HAD superfamily hydrolase (TIGR01509 family)
MSGGTRRRTTETTSVSAQKASLPAAAVFDWDGTIVDTLPLIYRANATVLGELGIVITREWFREQYTPDWRRGYRELGVPEELWERTSGRWAEEMGRMRPRALPWARGGLRRLRRHGVRLGLVTASTRAVVEPNLERLNLLGAFETAWYGDDVRNGKPHPEALLLALRALDLAAADTVYVGDTPVDLEMAHAAGAAFVAVGSTTSAEAFRAAGADRLWPGVGAWADDLLGRHAQASRPDPAAPHRRPSRGGRPHGGIDRG